MRPAFIYQCTGFAFCVLSAVTPADQARLAPTFAQVPGVVIDHSWQTTGIFIGSPSLAILANGDLVAAHDEFGPRSTESTGGVTQVFGSSDQGRTWRKLAAIRGQYWSTLFVHRSGLYLLGTDRHMGNVVIRRSADGGLTWTSPTNSATGRLSLNAGYHCAPVPVVEHGGRLWRAFERRDPSAPSGSSLCAGMLSAPVEVDLLDASNWTMSNFLSGNSKWLGDTFGGWLEGNAVGTHDGGLLDILRVDTPGYPEKAAMVNISPDGKIAWFNAVTGFIDFPGGAKKFTIRYDPLSGKYWSLASIVPEAQRSNARPASIRNTLALTCSIDLRSWTVQSVLLRNEDSSKHGFQYVDWVFDGDDIIAVCRTAYEDGETGAHSYHDANFLTFHRWRNFRNLNSGG